MSFYTSIASYYDMLFPYDEEQIKFLERVLENSGNDPVAHRSYLDLGCGTGTILSEFTDRFQKLAGIDIDAELLKLAAEKMYPGEEKKVELLYEDMMELENVFREDSFSFITCLGNTIPHLTGPGQIQKFLKTVYARLEAKGVFVFQTINYDRILDGVLHGLPTIEKGEVTFERIYSVPKSNGLIDFNTVLIDKKEESEVKNSVELFPLRKAQMREFLQTSGFKNIVFFGDYNGEIYQHESFLLIGVCSK